MNATEITFDGIFGQETAKRFLAQAFRQGRLAHCYLFFGPEGVGKLATALAFARALVCQSEQQRPCGTCRNCKLFVARSHPNVQVIFPHPKSAKESDVQAVLEEIFSQPYIWHSPWASPSISIDEVRSLRRELGLSSQGGEIRVILFLDAHLMTAEATNALLKTLEEPPELTYFVLISSSPDQLLPTILSRSQQVRFSFLSVQEITAGLARFTDLPEDRRRQIARFAQGSLRRALALAGENVQQLREQAVELLRAAFRNAPQRAMHVTQLVQQHDRRVLMEILESLLHWLRDAHYLRLGLGDDQPSVGYEDRETLQRFNERFADFDFDSAIAEVDLSIHMLRRYVQPNLVLSVLLNHLRRCEKHANSTEKLRRMAL
ncbi:MAG: DNA polymerase III subunit delta' [candidate division KSB1 bacterium]|nr:DNA polymerase III subunit delta' [candidate division KSB1 bacterium]